MTKTTYADMVDSGIEWIGKIPNGWEVRKVSHSFQVNRGRVIDKTQITEEPENDYTYPVYSSQTHKDGCLGYIQTYDYDKDSITWTTDGANAGSVFFRQGKFNATNVCGILTLLDSKQNYQYLTHALRLAGLVNRREDVLGYKLMSNEMAAIKFPLPPLNTQQAIASYLDTKTAEIDEAISLKTQQIELLREKRTALINHVVTKGLDPDVELVDSGIEWIGKIPKGWEVRKIRSLLMKKEIEYQDGNHGELHPKSEDYEDEGIPFIMASDVRDNKINFENCKKIPKYKTDKLRIGYSHTGDVLFTHKGTIGEVAVVPQLNSDYIMLTPQVTYYRILNNQLLNNKYLAAFFSAPIFKNQLDLICSMQSTRDYIGLIAQRNLIIVIPTISEQEKISSYLDNETVQIDNTISLIQQSIDHLVEYKQSLISHVVTGKVKVG